MHEKDRLDIFVRKLIELSSSVDEWNKVSFYRLVMDSYREFLKDENEEIKRIVEGMAEIHGIRV